MRIVTQITAGSTRRYRMLPLRHNLPTTQTLNKSAAKFRGINMKSKAFAFFSAMTLKRMMTLSLVGSICLLVAAGTCFAQQYTVTDLDPSGAYNYAYAINASGQVVGTTADFRHTRSFRTAPNSPVNPATDDLGTLVSAESP